MYNRYAYHPAPGSPLYHTLEQALTERGATATTTPGCTDSHTTTACAAIDAAAVTAAAAGSRALGINCHCLSLLCHYFSVLFRCLF